MTLTDYQKQAMTTCMDSCNNFSYMMLNLVGEVGDDYMEKLERGECDHIGEPTEKVDWDYWHRMYAGMAMQGFCRENGTIKSANMVASVSIEYADALIAELKKTK